MGPSSLIVSGIDNRNRLNVGSLVYVDFPATGLSYRDGFIDRARLIECLI